MGFLISVAHVRIGQKYRRLLGELLNNSRLKSLSFHKNYFQGDYLKHVISKPKSEATIHHFTKM